MSASTEPPSSPLPQAIPALRARRCSRHSAREAVARCPTCAGFFCRECIVEHDGQVICASCLARQVASAASVSGQRGKALTRVREGAALGLGLLVLWLLFYGFGSLLLRVPADLHDGTIWKGDPVDLNESSD